MGRGAAARKLRGREGRAAEEGEGETDLVGGGTQKGKEGGNKCDAVSAKEKETGLE